MPHDLENDTDRGFGRRAIVRSAIWTVPVVIVAAPAPAFAASSSLRISSFTAKYLNNPTVATLDASKLVVNATFENWGNAATEGFAFTMTIPVGLYYTAPTASTPPGWAVPVVTGSGQGPWTIKFTRSSAMPAGASGVPLATTVTFTDPLVVPYRRWAGSAFSLDGVASATNATDTAIATAPVARTDDSPFASDGAAIAASVGYQYRARARIDKLWNGGGSTIGRIRIRVLLDKQTVFGNVFYNGAEVTPEDYDTAKWTFLGSNAAESPGGAGPWWWDFEAAYPGAEASSPSDRGGSPGTDGPPDPAFEAYIRPKNRNLKIGVILRGTRGFTITAPHATEIFLNDGD